jgi:hypothetical protein
VRDGGRKGGRGSEESGVNGVDKAWRLQGVLPSSGKFFLGSMGEGEGHWAGIVGVLGGA